MIQKSQSFLRKYLRKITIDKVSRNISLIGAGRVGRSLLSALVQAGNKPVAIISGSSKSAGALAEIVGCPLFGEDIALIPELTDLIILTLPDDSLDSVIENIRREWKYRPGTLVIHTSGIRESAILNPLLECGARTVSIHPAASFPAEEILALKGIHFGIEGNERGAAEELISSIGGIPMNIEPGKKALYHAACTLASGYLNILMEASSELMGNAGIKKSEDIVMELAGSALKGWNKSGIHSLTGSIVRGDIESVKSHLNALEINEQNLDIYRVLALKTVWRCEAEGIIAKNRAEELKAALKQN